MIEYRKERVDTAYEDYVIRRYLSFGWTLCSSDEVYHENTEIAGVDVTSYGNGFIGGFMKGFTGKDGYVNVRQRRNVTNYSVLIFGRDTDMPNYNKLKDIEERYNAYANITNEPVKPIKRTVASAIAWAIIIISVIMLLFDSSNHAELWEILVSIATFVFTIPLVALSWVRYKKKCEEYENNINRMSELLLQAEELLTETNSHI